MQTLGNIGSVSLPLTYAKAREASFEPLVRFNLITITRGGKDAADLNTDKTR